MGYTKNLDSFGFFDPLDHPDKKEPDFIDMGKAVRDANYHMLWDNNKRPANHCRLVCTCLLAHPEGLTDDQISIETGLKRSTINGRRNDLIKRFGVPIYSIDRKYFPDENGHMVLRNLWAIRGDALSD